MDIHLNVKHETMKLLENDVRDNLADLDLGDDFLDTISKAGSMREKMINWT